MGVHPVLSNGFSCLSQTGLSVFDTLRGQGGELQETLTFATMFITSSWIVLRLDQDIFAGVQFVLPFRLDELNSPQLISYCKVKKPW